MHSYNHDIPQRALDHLSPVQALKLWRSQQPELFVKKVYEQAGLDKLSPTIKRCENLRERLHMYFEAARALLGKRGLWWAYA